MQNGAALNSPDGRGQTPLHKAASSGCQGAVQVVRMLLRAGANPNARNNCGTTPADSAISWALKCKSFDERRQCLDALEVIVDAGGFESPREWLIDIHLRMRHGQKAWHGAPHDVIDWLWDWK